LTLLKATRDRPDKDIPSQHCLQQHQALLLGALLPCLSSTVSVFAQTLAATAILRCISIGVFTGAGAAKRITKSFLSAWTAESSSIIEGNSAMNISNLLKSIAGLLLLAIFVPGRKNAMFESRFPQSLTAYEEELVSDQQPSFGVLEEILTIKSSNVTESHWFGSNKSETVIRLSPVFREAVVATMTPSLSALVQAWTGAREANSDGRISIMPLRALSAAAWLISPDLPFPVFSTDSCTNRFSTEVLAQFLMAEKSFKGAGVTLISLASAVISKSPIVFLFPLVSKASQAQINDIANLLSSSLLNVQPDHPSSFYIAKAMLTSGCVTVLCQDDSSSIVSWLSSSITATLASKTDVATVASFWRNVLLPFIYQSSTSSNAIQRILVSLWAREALTTKDEAQRGGSLSGMIAFLTTLAATTTTLSSNALSLAQLSVKTSASILNELQSDVTLADKSAKDVECPNRDASLSFSLITAASLVISSLSADNIPRLLKSCLPLFISFMQPGQHQQEKRLIEQHSIEENDGKSSPNEQIDTGWVSKSTALSGAQCAFSLAKRSPVAFKGFIQDLEASNLRSTFEAAMRAGLASNTAASLEPLPTRFKGVLSSATVSLSSEKAVQEGSAAAGPSLGSFKLLAKKFSTASSSTLQSSTSAPSVSAPILAPSISLLQVDEEEDWMVAARKARDAERDNEEEEEEEREEDEDHTDKQRGMAVVNENEEEKGEVEVDNDTFADKEIPDNEDSFTNDKEDSFTNDKVTTDTFNQNEEEDDDFADFDSAPPIPSSSSMISPSGKSVSGEAESYSPAQPVAISQEGVVDLPDDYEVEENFQTRLEKKEELVPDIVNNVGEEEEEENFGDFASSNASKESNDEEMLNIVGISNNNDKIDDDNNDDNDDDDDDDFGDLEDGFKSSAPAVQIQPKLASTIKIDDDFDENEDEDEFGDLS